MYVNKWNISEHLYPFWTWCLVRVQGMILLYKYIYLRLFFNDYVWHSRSTWCQAIPYRYRTIATGSVATRLSLKSWNANHIYPQSLVLDTMYINHILQNNRTIIFITCMWRFRNCIECPIKRWYLAVAQS